MKKIRIVSIVLILSFLLAPILGSWPTQKVSAAVTALSVNTGSVIQPNFLGLGGVYHGFSYMPESNVQGMTDELRAIDFDRVDRSKLSIARTWYGTGWAMPIRGGAYTWNSTKMTAFYSWLQAMKDRGVDVALNMGWWFSEGLCGDEKPAVCTPNDTTDVDIYTKWVSDSLTELITVRGFTNIKYIIAFTEPGITCGCGAIPAGYTQMSYYNLVINALHTRLVSDGTRNLTKIVGPNSNYYGTDITWVENAVTNLNSAIDIYSSHGYDYVGYDGWYNATTSSINAIASTGKPFWLDEYGQTNEAYRNTNDYGTFLAEINAAAINAKAQHSSIWLYEDQFYVTPLQNYTTSGSFYNGEHRWGTQKWLPTSTAVRPAWYAFTMMSRFLGVAGTQVYDTTKSLNGIRISAMKQPDGNWSIMVVNSNTTAQDISVNFTGAINKTLWRHLYDPNNVPTGDGIIGASAQYTNVTTSLTDTLPARGVAIYTSIDDGSAIAPNQLTGKQGEGEVSLSWKAPLSGATSYNIKRSTSFGGPYTTIQTGVTTTSYTNTSLTNNTTYYYVVTAVNGTESGNSNQAVLTPSIGSTNLASEAAVTSTSTVEYSGWGQVKVNDGQQNSVVSSDGWSNGWSSASNLTVNHTESITLDLLSMKTVSKVDLYPRNDSDNLGTGFPIDFTIKTSTDNVTYTTVVTKTGYALPGNGVQSFSFTPASARYVKVEGTNLRINGSNQYRMQFAEIEIYKKIPAPTGLSAKPLNGQVSLNWTATTGATSYNVKRSKTSGGPYTTIVKGITTTSYTDPLVSNNEVHNQVNGTMFYYVVSATNSSGESDNSIQDSAMPNFAGGAAITSSSSVENSDWGMGKAIDGNRGSASGYYGWSSNSNLTVNHTESITLDMLSNINISKVDLYPRMGIGNVGYGFPIDFTIKTSQDNVTYTTVVTQTGYALPGDVVQSFGFETTPARYVKIEGTSLRSNPNDANLYRMQFAEIEIYRFNFAYAATTTATSSMEYSGFGKAQVNDRKRSSVSEANGESNGWSSNNTLTVNHTESITFDMLSNKTISYVNLYPRNDIPSNVGVGFPIDFTIKTSLDNVTYTTVVTRTGFALPGNIVQSFNFASTSARYVKVEGTNLRINGSNYRMQFPEIEIYQ